MERTVCTVRAAGCCRSTPNAGIASIASAAGIASVAGVALAMLLAAPSAAIAQAPFACFAFQLGNESAGCAASGAAEDIRGGLGIGHSGGASLPGTASALGRRFGATPRIAFAGRASLVRFDRTSADSWGAGPGSGNAASGWSPVFGATIGVGAFDGFSAAPTVSGVLGVDVLADVSTVRLPSDDSFEGASTAWGYGVRVGLIRESFTLPGASVSVMRRSGASYVMEGEDGSLDADVTTTSIRATLGKELLGFGVHGGVGWDRVSTAGRIQADGSGGPAVEIDFDDERETHTVVFGGVTRTFLVTSIGADIGWSGDVAFGSISLRLTL